MCRRDRFSGYTPVDQCNDFPHAPPCGLIVPLLEYATREVRMSLRFTITLVLSIICLAVPAWADFQAGMDANNRGDYATALREWQPLAEQGDALAQYNLGVLYRKGRGVPQDDVQARQWYAKAAAQGQAKAQFNLGTLYFNGEGVPKDYQQALRWFRLAADQGEALAQTKIGHHVR